MVDDSVDLTLLDQFHVVFVHLFVEIYGSDVELEMAFGYSQ